MVLAPSTNTRLAILIDADNVSATLIQPLFYNISKLGIASVKRIYGDWTSTQLAGWKNHLHKFAIHPIQQFQYTNGKNSTDSALIIDAMDLLYTDKFDGFCLISSDGDFTRLASRIRESGLLVYGFGEQKKTPQAFVAACSRFFYTDTPEKKSEVEKKKDKDNQKLIKLLKSAYQGLSNEDGWVCLGGFGSQITKLDPTFNLKHYGYSKLSNLIKSVDCFEVKASKNDITLRLKAS